MKIKTIILYLPLIFASLSQQFCWAHEPWKLKLTWESQRQTDRPFVLMTAADIDRNGVKELVVTDFGDFGEHLGASLADKYNMFIFEWGNNSLKLKLHRQWDKFQILSNKGNDNYVNSIIKGHYEEKHNNFVAYKAKQMVSWQVGDRVAIEMIPPYLELEWENGKYLIRDEQVWDRTSQDVGSWFFSWMSASCYQGFTQQLTWPRECLVGIRDFSGKNEPKIVTIFEEKIENIRFKQTLRIRKLSPDFPIEWEKVYSTRFSWSSPVDRLNQHDADGILMIAFKTADWYFLDTDEESKGYSLRPIRTDRPRGIETFLMPDVYLRKTQNNNIDEYWGFRFVEATDKGKIALLRKVVLKPDLSGFVSEDVEFSHHDSFLGVTYFAVEDLDSDGLAEVILVERTGKRAFGEDITQYSNLKDYIHILKWNGKKYQTMWVSPPYTKRGTKFLVEDIKNTGKKQLVVLAPNGTIQIWERQ